MDLPSHVKDKPGVSEDVLKLCDHLNSIGVRSRVIDKDGAEAIHHHVPPVFNNPLKAGRTGVVLVESRNVEYVELIKLMYSNPEHNRSNMPPVQWIYKYVYALRADVKGKEKAIEATSRPIIRSPSASEVYLKSIEWDGAELAGRLRSDEVLRGLMMSTRLVDIHVEGIGKDAYVAIVKEGTDKYEFMGLSVKIGCGDFPSPQEFEVYDRIAGHVKSMVPRSS